MNQALDFGLSHLDYWPLAVIVVALLWAHARARQIRTRRNGALRQTTRSMLKRNYPTLD
jgi:hypothetical protein